MVDVWSAKAEIVEFQDLSWVVPDSQFLTIPIQLVTMGMSGAVLRRGQLRHVYALEQYLKINSFIMAGDNPQLANSFAEFVKIKTQPRNPSLKAKRTVFPLVTHTPDTTVGEATYTMETSRSVSLGISLAGDGPMGSFETSMSSSNGSQVSIPDVSCLNTSMSDGNDASWTFRFENNDKDLRHGVPTTISTSLFSPVFSMVWVQTSGCDPNAGEMGFRTDIEVQYGKYDTSRKFWFPNSATYSLPVPPKTLREEFAGHLVSDVKGILDIVTVAVPTIEGSPDPVV